MTIWLDPLPAPLPGFRALGLAVLINEERWDACEELLAGVAEREGIAAMEALDAQALEILVAIAQDEFPPGVSRECSPDAEPPIFRLTPARGAANHGGRHPRVWAAG